MYIEKHFTNLSFPLPPLLKNYFTSKGIFSYLHVDYKCIKFHLLAKLLTKFIFLMVLKCFPYHSSLPCSLSLHLLHILFFLFNFLPYFKVPCYCLPPNTFDSRFFPAFYTEHPSNLTS